MMKPPHVQRNDVSFLTNLLMTYNEVSLWFNKVLYGFKMKHFMSCKSRLLYIPRHFIDTFFSLYLFLELKSHYDYVSFFLPLNFWNPWGNSLAYPRMDFSFLCEVLPPNQHKLRWDHPSMGLVSHFQLYEGGRELKIWWTRKESVMGMSKLFSLVAMAAPCRIYSRTLLVPTNFM